MSKREGCIIIDNPLRILGVLSDTPKKEIVANLGKLRAFAKTGKILSFDTDFTELLGPVNRTIDSIEKANNDISLPKDKLQAGMFWFMQHTENDKLALDCLKRGDSNEAMEIIQKKGNYSGVINMAVLALILNKWDVALYSYAYLLESDLRRRALIKAFTNTEDLYSEEDLADYISSKLIQDFPNAHWVDQLQHENIELGEKTYLFKSRFADSKLVIQLTNKCVTQIKKEIDLVLSKASSVSRKDTKANLKMAELVQNKCKYLLKELRLALGKNDRIYQDYADNVANQILDNCIDYYNNDSDNPKRERNVIKFIRFAFRTAEGKISKERAKKNLDILNETLDNLIPDSIEDEFNAIDKLVTNYHDTNAKYDYSYHLSEIIDEVYQKIQLIKTKLGKNNKHYISISSNFVYFAYQEIVKKVNALSNYSTFEGRLQYLSKLKWAKSLFDSLIKFDKDEECQTLFDKNYNSLMDLVCNNIAKPATSKPATSKPRITQRSPIHARPTYSSSNTQSGTSNRKESSESSIGIVKYICFGVALFAIVILFFRSINGNNDNAVEPQAVSTDISENSQNIDESNVSYSETDNSTTMESETSSYFADEKDYRTISFSTGDRPYKDYYGKGQFDKRTKNSLKILNGSSTDAVVFLETISGKKIRHVYVCKNESFTMLQIPGGKYIIKIIQGNEWNPDKYNGEGMPVGCFMKHLSMSKSESYDPFEYPSPSSGQYGTYEVTLYKTEDGNMQTESINFNEMF